MGREDQNPETANRWNRRHSIFLMLIFAGSLTLNLVNSDLGAPVYKKWFPFPTEMNSYFNSYGKEARGEFEYSSLGYQHYLPACLIYLHSTNALLKNPENKVGRNLREEECYLLLRWTNGIFGALFILLFGLLLRSIIEPRWLLISALLLCLNTQFIYWSHTESIMLLNVIWAMMCAVFFVRYLFFKSWVNLALMAVCGAISAGIKENTLALVPVLAFAGPMMANGFGWTLRTKKGFARLLLSLLICVVLFVSVLAMAYQSNPDFNREHFRFYLEGENTNYANASTQVEGVSKNGPTIMVVYYFRNLIDGLLMLSGEVGIALLIPGFFGIFFVLRNFRSDPALSGFFVALLAYLLSYISLFPIFWRLVQGYDLLFPLLALMPIAAYSLHVLLSFNAERIIRFTSAAVTLFLFYCAFVAIMTVVSLKMDVRLKLEDYLAAMEKNISVTVVEYPDLKISLVRYPDRIVQEMQGPSVGHFAYSQTDFLVLDDNLRKRYIDSLNQGKREGRFIHERTFDTSRVISAFQVSTPTTLHLYRRK